MSKPAFSVLAATMLTIVGVGSVLWQTLGLWIVRQICPDKAQLFSVFLFFDALHIAGYALMWSPGTLLANASLAGAAVALPTILRAVVSEALPATAQGRGNGVISAVAGLSSCCAPITFGTLFLIGNKVGQPGLPFWVGISFLAIGGFLN